MNITVPQGYKQTKVGVIPEEWEVVRLGDVGEVISGLTYSPKDINRNGILVLRSSNIQNGKLAFEDNVYVDVADLKFNPVKENDILICVRNGSKSLIGKNALIDKKNEGVAFGAFMSVYRSKYNTFMFQFFDTQVYKREVYRNLGATINSINGSDLKKFRIPFPSLKEQQKIAQILTTWDKAISKQEALIAEKEQLKKGLMQKLLSGEVRFKGFDGEWEEVKLGDVGAFYKGKGISKNDITDDGIECIRYGELYTKYGERIETVISKTFLPNKNLFLSKKNDILIPASGETAIDLATASCITKDDVAIGGDINIIRTKMNGIFLSYYLSTIAKKKIASLAQGVSVIHLYSKQLKSLKIKFPPLEEQQKIAQILTTADKEIELLKEELEALKDQKRGLMQKLLMGEVRVRV